MLLITTEKRKQFYRNIEKLALQPNSDIAKSIYKGRNVLAPQIVN